VEGLFQVSYVARLNDWKLFQGSHFYSFSHLFTFVPSWIFYMLWTSVGEDLYFDTWHLLVLNNRISLACFDWIVLNDWKIEIMPLRDLWKFYLTDLFNCDNGVVFR
jgi:hypothetical protein